MPNNESNHSLEKVQTKLSSINKDNINASQVITLLRAAFPHLILEHFWDAPRTRVILPPSAGFSTLVRGIEIKAEQHNHAQSEDQDSPENKVLIIKADAESPLMSDEGDWWRWLALRLHEAGIKSKAQRKNTIYWGAAILAGIAQLIVPGGSAAAAIATSASGVNVKSELVEGLTTADIRKAIKEVQTQLEKWNAHIVLTIDPAGWRSSLGTTSGTQIDQLVSFLKFVNIVTGDFVEEGTNIHGHIHAVFLNIDSLSPELGDSSLFKDWKEAPVEPLGDSELLSAVSGLSQMSDSDFPNLFVDPSLVKDYLALSSGQLFHGIGILTESISLSANQPKISKTSLTRASQTFGRELKRKYDVFHKSFWSADDQIYSISFSTFIDAFCNMTWPLQYGTQEVMHERSIRSAIMAANQASVWEKRFNSEYALLPSAVSIGWLGTAEDKAGPFSFKRGGKLYDDQWLHPRRVLWSLLQSTIDLDDKTLASLPDTAKVLASQNPDHFVLLELPRETRPFVRLSTIVRYNLEKPIPRWIFSRVSVMRNGADPERYVRGKKGKRDSKEKLNIEQMATEVVKNQLGDKCLVFTETDWARHFSHGVLPLDGTSYTQIPLPLKRPDFSYCQPGIVEKSEGYRTESDRITYLFTTYRGLFISKHHIMEGPGGDPGRPLRASPGKPGLQKSLGLLTHKDTSGKFQYLWDQALNDPGERGILLRKALDSLEPYYSEKLFHDLKVRGTGMLILPKE